LSPDSFTRLLDTGVFTLQFREYCTECHPQRALVHV